MLPYVMQKKENTSVTHERTCLCNIDIAAMSRLCVGLGPSAMLLQFVWSPEYISFHAQLTA